MRCFVIRESPVDNINKYLINMDEDYLYHLSLEKKGDNLKEMFGDTKVLDFMTGFLFIKFNYGCLI